MLALEALRGSAPLEGARGFIEQAELISRGALLPPPADTSRDALEFLGGCLRSKPSDRLDTAALLRSAWMASEDACGTPPERTLAGWLQLLVLWGPGSVGEKLSKQMQLGAVAVAGAGVELPSAEPSTQPEANQRAQTARTG